jgi:hypothetical protein
MPVASTDILIKFSVTTGAAGDSTAGTAAGSLGKYVSTTQVTDNSANNLFDNISGDENAASTVDYRCFFVHNNHATISLQNAVVWLSSEVAGGASINIAIDNLAASAKGSSSAQAANIATEITVPSGVGSFSGPTTKGTGLSLGTLTAGQVRAVWVKRTAANTVALNSDGVTIRVEGDTAA